MGPEFVGRVIRTSAWVAPLSALYVAVYYDLNFALGLLAGTAWACANLYLIKLLVKKLVRPGERVSRRDVILLGCVKFPLLYGLGYLALRAEALPLMGLLAGFWLPKTIMVLKSVGALINRRYDTRRGTAVGVVVLLALGLWLAPQILGNGADVSAAPAAVEDAAVQQHGETGGQTETEHGDSEAAEGHGAQGQGHGESEAEHGEGHGEGGHGEGGGHAELPNFITVLVGEYGGGGLIPESAITHFIYDWNNLIFSLLCVLLLGLIVSAATRHSRLVPGRLQNTIEYLVESLDGFICGILGPRGRRYVPFLGSLFIFILFMNLCGLVPGLKSPTANINQTLAMALCVFLYVQYTGMRNFGLKGYLFHMAGEPRDAITWGLVPIMLPLHIVGELAKPMSLSLRLFGNITGEDILIVIFVTLGIGLVGFLHLPLGVPLQVPFVFLAILTSTIQALVFTLLSTVYFLMMMPHDEH